MIDNSRSMADKQAILADAVPDIVHQLVNPRCVDAMGNSTGTPATPADACPAGSQREFAPITDMHIGVISSSLGGHGADACSTQQSPSNNDRGHLLTRLDPSGMGGVVPTYQNKGFLAWDPTQQLSPPGTADATLIVKSFTDIIQGVGQVGCGYESQLESWYRFLVEPDPYDQIQVVNGMATPSGTDAALLAERADFLRPDSLVTILMLTDENDCSTKEYGQFFYANQIQNQAKAFHLPRPRSECANNPDDPCCKSCGQAPGNCSPDPTCTNNPTLSAQEDSLGLRCFDQKRRFGIDFLYPIDRYTQALTATMIADRNGQVVANPLFAGGRNASLVFIGGIVGVPWQDLARDPKDPSKGLKNAQELTNGNAWDDILGDPTKYVAPKDPFMVESNHPRSGTNPATGIAISPPGGPDNVINGHESSISNADDLEYACIFPLPIPRDCSNPAAQCDCGSPGDNNPVCQGNTQVAAKAYPGLREIAVLKSVGDQGIVTSICPSNLSQPASGDFGYRAGVRAVIDALRPGLAKP